MCTKRSKCRSGASSKLGATSRLCDGISSASTSRASQARCYAPPPRCPPTPARCCVTKRRACAMTSPPRRISLASRKRRKRISPRRPRSSTRRSRRRSCGKAFEEEARHSLTASDGNRTTKGARPAQTTVSLAPLDNHALANLCGPLDANLRQLEAASDVAIARRGGTFTLRGPAVQADRAAAALHRFYAQAAEPLTVDDIQLGLIEMGARRAGTAAADVAEEGPALRTRRADLHGRTPNQIAYLKHIQEHDVTFGIGPAGTGKTYLAVACAVDALERDAVKRIVLVRPAVEAGERLGFLPGASAPTVDPYLRPLYDRSEERRVGKERKRRTRGEH